MHSVAVHAIAPSGEVVPYGTVPNAHACSLHILRSLSGKYGCRFDPFGVYRAAELTRLFGSPTLDEDDAIVLGFTFEHVWVRSDNLERLAAALEGFWSEHSRAVALTGESFEVEPTIPRVVELLRRAAGDEEVRGVCFDQTSVAPSVWIGPGKEPFRFGAGGRALDGGEPVELIEELERRRADYASEPLSGDAG